MAPRPGPELVGSARAAAHEVEITGDDDALAARMIAATEGEIFSEATGEQEPENDGDKSLEQMAEGFDDETREEQDEQEAGPEDPDAEVREPDGEDDGELADEIDDRQEVLQTRQPERQERRQPTEQETIAELRERLARLEGARDAAPQPVAKPAEPAAKPDMFAEPEKYEAWVLDQAEQRAMARFEQVQSQQRTDRLNAEFDAAARGERGQEFLAAHRAIMSVRPGADPRHDAAVTRILNSPDPAAAVFDWADRTGVLEEFQQGILAAAERILGRQIAPRRGERGSQQPAERSAQNGSRARMPPSLNGRSGSGTHREIDPEMHNGSEESIFGFATRQ